MNVSGTVPAATDLSRSASAREVWEEHGCPNWVTDSMLDSMSGEALLESLRYPASVIEAIRRRNEG